MRNPFCQRHSGRHRSGLTLVELVVVLVILIALAGIVVPRLQRNADSSTVVSSNANLAAVRDAVMQYWLDTKYETLPGQPTTAASDTDTTLLTNEENRFQVRWLFENPANDPSVAVDDTLISFDRNSRLGWNGPYLSEPSGRYVIEDADNRHDLGTNFSSVYGSNGDPAVLSVILGRGADLPRPLVIQAIDNGTTIDCRVVAAGENDRIDIPHDASTTSLTAAVVGDDNYVSFTLRR